MSGSFVKKLMECKHFFDVLPLVERRLSRRRETRLTKKEKTRLRVAFGEVLVCLFYQGRHTEDEALKQHGVVENYMSELGVYFD